MNASPVGLLVACGHAVGWFAVAVQAVAMAFWGSPRWHAAAEAASPSEEICQLLPKSCSGGICCPGRYDGWRNSCCSAISVYMGTVIREALNIITSSGCCRYLLDLLQDAEGM